MFVFQAELLPVTTLWPVLMEAPAVNHHGENGPAVRWQRYQHTDESHTDRPAAAQNYLADHDSPPVCRLQLLSPHTLVELIPVGTVSSLSVCKWWPTCKYVRQII